MTATGGPSKPRESWVPRVAARAERVLSIAARAWPDRAAGWVDTSDSDGDQGDDRDEGGDDLDRACAFLGLAVDADHIAAAAATSGVVGGASVLVIAVAAMFVGGSWRSPLTAVLVGCVPIAAGWLVTASVQRAPVIAASAVRTRAVADATTLVSALALSLRLNPVPERAVQFAASGGDGPLHRSLREHGERAAICGGVDGGLSAFAATWRRWFPALDRSVALLIAASGADPDEDRPRLLTRAVSTIEEDLRDRSASFAGDLRGPVTGLYAFGVLLPLALVGTLPAAVASGVAVPPLAFVVVYDLLLPVGLAVAAGRLLLRRPIALPAPRIDASHPAVPERRAVTLGGGAAGAALAWLIAPLVIGGWASPVLAVGVGLGTVLVAHLHPRREVRRAINERDRGLSDALALLGRRVADGEAVERALPTVASSLGGPTGDALAAAAQRRSALGVTVETALAGEGAPFGPTRGAGGRATGAVTAIVAAVAEGRPAGDALVSHADRLAALADAERAARRELATVTSTLRDTAALFGPLVGGATVALAGRLDGLAGLDGAGGAGVEVSIASRGVTAPGVGAAAGDTAAAGTALSASLVGPVVGVYVLTLAATLTALATGLERGVDATLVGYRVGLTLITASGAFVAGHAAVAMIVG
jgi:hypothetical protein